MVETAAFFPAKTLLFMYCTFKSTDRNVDRTDANTPTLSRCLTLTCDVPSPSGDSFTQFLGFPSSKLVIASITPFATAMLACFVDAPMW